MGGRHRKPDDERRQPVTINLRPAEYDQVYTLARAQDTPVAVVLRELLVGQLVKQTAEKSS